MFVIFLIEMTLGLIVFIPFFLIVKYVIKSAFKRSLLYLLALLSGYIALFSSLMTKITPNLSLLNSSNVLKILVVVISFINITVFLQVIMYAANLKIIEPLNAALKQKQATEEILRNQRNELRLFNNFIAHDIKNFLTNIKGYSELLLSEKFSEEPTLIIKKVDHLNDLLDQSLQLAEAGKIIDSKATVDLNDLLQECFELLNISGVDIKLSSLPSLLGDKYKLKQAFSNILKNIIKHSTPNMLCITSKQENEELILLISNNGKNIPNTIIDEFGRENYAFKIEEKNLGLKIIKRIISAHNWEISLINEPNPSYKIQIPWEDYF